jgi:ribosomal protein S18 acetylase RimI-like enzyme
MDLPALEWGGEFIHFRRVYHHAMLEAKQGKRVILVAEAEGVLIGQIFVNYYSTWRNSKIGLRTGYIHSFRVKPEYRNQGIGRNLIQTAEAYLERNGFDRVIISVAQENQGALRLYQGLGYEILHKDPGRWSFRDHQDQIQHIHEPAFVLCKSL